MTDTTQTTPPPLAPGPPVLDPRVARAIELVWREAELLDRKQYATWQDLYAEDGRYVIPINPGTEDFDNTLNMVYDDARMRRMRVTRMTEGYAIAAVDAARTVRTVSRFIPETVRDTQVVLRSAQILIAYKRGHHHIWAADLTHHIRLSPHGPHADRIALKVIRLVDSEDPVPAAGFLP